MVIRLFATIEQASKYTGLAQSYIRAGVKNGTIPHIKSGRKYLVNMLRFLEMIEATENTTGGEIDE